MESQNTRKETCEGLFGGREVPCGDASQRLELPTLHPLSGTSMWHKKRPMKVSLVGAKRLELPTSSM
jgi:hypothetical protein